MTQVLVGKLKATHRLRNPITVKNPTQLKFTVRQMESGRAICELINDLMPFFLSTSWPNSKVPPMTQYSTVGFHLMKFSLWK